MNLKRGDRIKIKKEVIDHFPSLRDHKGIKVVLRYEGYYWITSDGFRLEEREIEPCPKCLSSIY